MRNINYIIQGVLAVAVVVLFMLQFSTRKGGVFDPSGSVDSLGCKLPVAYVNVDSLLRGYNYSKDMNEVFLNKAEDTRANLNEKANSFQSEYLAFQKKIENNAFLTRERAEQEAGRLQSKQQKLQQESERVQMDLAREQQKMNEQLRDTIIANLKSFNESRKYHIIFAGETVLYGDDSYDITAEVIEFLNEKYTPTGALNASKK
jgi:outer membrane protein